MHSSGEIGMSVIIGDDPCGCVSICGCFNWKIPYLSHVCKYVTPSYLLLYCEMRNEIVFVFSAYLSSPPPIYCYLVKWNIFCSVYKQCENEGSTVRACTSSVSVKNCYYSTPFVKPYSTGLISSILKRKCPIYSYVILLHNVHKFTIHMWKTQLNVGLLHLKYTGEIDSNFSSPIQT